MYFLSAFVCILAILSFSWAQAFNYVGSFKNEKGGFELSWGYPSVDEIQFKVTLAGDAFVGIGESLVLPVTRLYGYINYFIC